MRSAGRESGSGDRSCRRDGIGGETGWRLVAVRMVAVSFWSSYGSEIGGIPPMFLRRVWKSFGMKGIVKMGGNESVEVADGMGLAGRLSAGRVRRGDFHILW